MVEAVSAGEGKVPCKLKFELMQTARGGQAFRDLPGFHSREPARSPVCPVRGGEGLEMVNGRETEQFARPVVGTAITHTLTVLPKRDGIFNVQAVVLMDSDTESVSRKFSIPLIAGSGIAEWSPKKVAARGDDAG